MSSSPDGALSEASASITGASFTSVTVTWNDAVTGLEPVTVASLTETVTSKMPSVFSSDAASKSEAEPMNTRLVPSTAKFAASAPVSVMAFVPSASSVMPIVATTTPASVPEKSTFSATVA